MGRRTEKRQGRRRECRRILLAQEAARLICDHGIRDFRTAKDKAAWALGLTDDGALPSNREIEAAVAERNRIFMADGHARMLNRIRTVALEVMYDLTPFRPCLVGSVLSGNVTEHTTINMHLFADVPELVGLRLDACGIHYQLRQRRYCMRRGRFEVFAGFDFLADDFVVETTVFCERRKRQAPLSPVDGRPMRRARLRDVETLVQNAPPAGGNGMELIV